MAIKEVECQTDPSPQKKMRDDIIKSNASMAKKYQSYLSKHETIRKQNEELEEEIQKLKSDFSERERELQVRKMM